jgi:hypothetical protein
MNEIKKHFGLDTNLDIPLEKMMELYPKVKNRVIPLSVTGVAARTFFHWKNNGVIDYPIASTDERIRVMLNLFEYVWIRVCVLLREFGLPLSTLKDAKTWLFQDLGESMILEKEALQQIITANAFIDAENKKFITAFLPNLEQHYNELTEEYRIYTSLIGTLIAGILFYNQEASIIIIKRPNENEFRTLSWNTFAEYEENYKSVISYPHLMIPLRPILNDFLKNNGNEKYLDKFEFFQPKEKLILDCLKKKDFSELQIKNIEGDLRIVKSEDLDIKGEKASEIRRIFALNDYTEVTLCQRNGKHIHSKRKTKFK